MKSNQYWTNDRLLDVIKLALKLQEGVENTRPNGYGTPCNTLTWMEWFKNIIKQCE